MVLDEAHRLKNKRSNTTKVLSQLPCCRKLLLTGTPLQNNTK
jgi:SNF2 family DNA or RNA helicase